tara:strand:+ start:4414 stop:5010 length:597 start_codon:yes stop_codon:yes gene_type:complete
MDKNDKMDNPRNSPDINNGRNTTFNNAVDFLGDVTLFKDVTSVKIITDEIGSSSGQLNISSDVNITGTASVKEVFEKVNQRKETSGTKNIDISAGSLHFFSEYATGNCIINLRYDDDTKLGDVMKGGTSIVVTTLLSVGASSYYVTDLHIDGATQNINWILGNTPTGGFTNSINAYTFAVIRKADLNYVVLGTLTQFG